MTAEEKSARSTAETPGGTMRILLAEDSADNRLLIEVYLRNSPYQLDAAENGAVAVEKFIAGRYDLVLMDIHMPVMDGFTAVRKIRQWEREHQLEPTPIVALTASALEEGVRESREAGCTAHLSKPIRKSTLLDALVHFARRRTSADGDRNAARIVIEADPDLRDLIPDFLARKRDDLTNIASALARRDYAALSALGHRIKGEGGGFGFEALSEIGAALERDANERDASAAYRHLQGLADYLNRVSVVFRDQAGTRGKWPG